MVIKIDPSQPVTVAVDIQGIGGPVLAAYHLWVSHPDDIISTLFGQGTDKGPDAGMPYPFQLTLEDGSQLLYYALLTASGTALNYRMVLTIQQQGLTLPDGTITLEGELTNEQPMIQGQIGFVV